MIKRSISLRWFLNSFCVVAVVLLCVLTAIGFFVKSSYYGNAEQILRNHASGSGVTTLFSDCTNFSGSEFHDKAQEYISAFTDKARMEVLIIDENGMVVASGSGFNGEGLLGADYENALTNSTGAAVSISHTSNGEKIMSLTALLAKPVNGKAPAISFVTSLEKIDRQLLFVVLILVLVFIAALSLLGFSGLYFIRSIVHPVEQIAQNAKIIAEGNYQTEIPIESRYSDELSDLCRTFNDMSNSLGSMDRMKNDFISTVSHELRTPLTAIKGWTETISACPNDSEMVSHASDIILSETENLSIMVEDLLDFSKLESGRMKINPTKIDAIAELADAVFAMLAKAKRKNLELEYIENENVAAVFADSMRLRQVFVNIIDNAIKYTDAGKITVSSDITDCEFVVTVADSGCGIPEESLPHIKEKFYKANINKKGSGIGLAVCDEILRLHGGRLDIKSKLNEGTSVQIVLPLMKGE